MEQIRNYIDIGGAFEAVINWLMANMSPVFDAISTGVRAVLDAFNAVLSFPPPLVMTVLFALIAWRMAGRWVAGFTLFGFLLIEVMGLWAATMATLGLVLTSVIISMGIGIPLGIWASKSDLVEQVVRPILDFMQTLPAFVYLIPAVLFFRLGPVPGVVATLIFSLPPAVRPIHAPIRSVMPVDCSPAESTNTAATMIAGSLEKPARACLASRIPVRASASRVSMATRSTRIRPLTNSARAEPRITRKTIWSSSMQWGSVPGSRGKGILARMRPPLPPPVPGRGGRGNEKTPPGRGFRGRDPLSWCPGEDSNLHGFTR